VRSLGQTRLEPALVGAIKKGEESAHCRIQDRVIEEFLDGSGI
jgi:serine O-acetyltransferase